MIREQDAPWREIDDERSREETGRFGTFARTVGNESAYNLASAVAAGTESFGVITGPAGWGKTHLLSAVACDANGGGRAFYVSSMEFAKPRREVEQADVLVIDDLHLALANPRIRHRLSYELERRVKSRRTTLCACPDQASVPAAVLPVLRGWRWACVSPPSKTEVIQILRKMCLAERIEMRDEGFELISRLVAGDGRNLFAAITRLRIAMGGDLRTVRPTRIAGVLSECQSEEAKDLRDVIVDSVALAIPLRTKRCNPSCQRMASIYIMRREAGITEMSVAEYFGIRHGEVYQLNAQAEKLSADCRDIKLSLERSIALVDSRLLNPR